CARSDGIYWYFDVW
nr:immunoglobulin heavy chain junction region [Mus musculus]